MVEVLFISLIHLIQHPDFYDQKQVRMVGFASFKFESKALYVSAEDYHNAVTKNAIWIDVDLSDNVRKLHEKYVIVEGTFDRKNLGHLKLYSGSLKNVMRLELWKKD